MKLIGSGPTPAFNFGFGSGAQVSLEVQRSPGSLIIPVAGRDGTGLEIRGVVDTYTQLPTTDLTKGDVYVVRADGQGYIWSGIAWPAKGQGFAIEGPKGDTGRGYESVRVSGNTLVFEGTDETTETVTVPALTAAQTAAQTATTKASEAATSATTASTKASEAAAAAQVAVDAAADASEVVGSGTPNATDTVKGGIRLTGDLGGTWDNPTVPGLADKATHGLDLVASYSSGDFTSLNFATPGNYRIRTGTGYVTGGPSTSSLWWNVLAVNAPDTATANTTLFFATTTSTASIYARVKYGNTWGGWVTLNSPFSAMSVAEGTAGTATGSRVVRADYLKQIINYFLTGSTSTSATAIGQALAAAADAGAARTTIGAAAASDLTAKADLVNGKVPQAQIPAVALREFLGNASSQTAMLALNGQMGDWCNRTDLGSSWELIGSDPTNLAHWQEHLHPQSPVQSVAGRIGAVTLSADDISDAGDRGRALMRSSTALDARLSIGAGTSSLALGTTATSAMAGDRIQLVTALPTTPDPSILYLIAE